MTKHRQGIDQRQLFQVVSGGHETDAGGLSIMKLGATFD